MTEFNLMKTFNYWVQCFLWPLALFTFNISFHSDPDCIIHHIKHCLGNTDIHSPVCQLWGKS